MKKAFLIILLLILPSAFAIADEIRLLTEGESYVLNTKNVTLYNVYSDGRVRVGVGNSTTALLSVNESRVITRANITINQTFFSSSSEASYAYIRIQVLAQNECSTDTDCSDGKISTIDKCNKAINTCTHTTITVCEGGDEYCPSGCSLYSDSDCATGDKCYSDGHCNDNNPGTVDSCSGNALIQGTCVHEEITTCIFGDDFCPKGCINSATDATKRDSDCLIDNACNSDSDCDDEDPSTPDVCMGDGRNTARYCESNATIICRSNDGDCPANCDYTIDSDCPSPYLSSSTSEEIILDPCNSNSTKVQNNRTYYCFNNRWTPLKVGGARCEQDVECKIGVCKEDGTCMDETEAQEKNYTLILSIIFSFFLALVVTYFYYLYRLRGKLQNKNL